MSEEDRYVRRDECIKHVTGIENELAIIKDALVGHDLRGGLVKDINKVFIELALLKKESRNGIIRNKISKKGWFAIGSSAITAAASFLVAIFK